MEAMNRFLEKFGRRSILSKELTLANRKSRTTIKHYLEKSSVIPLHIRTLQAFASSAKFEESWRAFNVEGVLDHRVLAKLDACPVDVDWWDAQLSELLSQAGVRLTDDSARTKLVALAMKLVLQESGAEEVHCECQLLAHHHAVHPSAVGLFPYFACSTRPCYACRWYYGAYKSASPGVRATLTYYPKSEGRSHHWQGPWVFAHPNGHTLSDSIMATMIKFTIYRIGEHLLEQGRAWRSSLYPVRLPPHNGLGTKDDTAEPRF
ncbi:hypothetical protein BOTBODRAFT_183586 [Botryobasidium botryosum FD-172 SS1]|uniref:Uncharacterized protein n=1 Tax=Botryobasidium botryosum (strain FD-172 SS1) TaxID=930990 RepID=A0A067N9V3_BOTB1|nr:hypothetical protein BOTBODRAFT_183586 [Botryobasidium botryosum FD-172 SS1]